MLPLCIKADCSCINLIATRELCTLVRKLLLSLVSALALYASAVEGQDQSEVELVNFAFANYLGTGFYASRGGEVFILRIPLSSTLRPMTSNDPGWVINYPITLGVADIQKIAGGEISPSLDQVGTASLIPGVEYHYPVIHNWQLIPFIDLGLARDFYNNENIRVLGSGVKSFATFDFNRNRLTLGNRFLYADQKNLEQGGNSNFAVFQTGLDYNIPTDFTFHGSFIDFSFYYINYYYLKDLVLVDALDNPISLENKNEIGFTVSLPEYTWLPESPRVGFGVQVTKNARLYRIVFGMPFF